MKSKSTMSDTFMVNKFSARVPMPFNGEKNYVSKNGAGQLYIHIQSNKFVPLSQTLYKY